MGTTSSNRAVIVVVVMASFLTSFLGSALNVSIPTIGAEFQAPAASLGWLATTYNMCTVILLIPLGRLADLTSRRAVMITGLVILAVVAAAAQLTNALSALIIVRLLQGIGAACLFATQQAIITDAVPPAARGQALGLSVSAVYIGLSVGPVVGGLLTHNLGWRSIFWFAAAWALATVVLAVARLPRPAPTTERARLDGPSIAWYLTGTTCLTFGLSTLSDGWHAYALVAAGVVLLVIFARRQLRAVSPLLNPALFRAGPAFVLSNLSALLSYAATFALSYLLAIYLQRVQGMGADAAGLVLIASPLVQAVFSPITGRLSDHHSPQALASLGMGLCTLGLVGFVFLDAQTPLAVIIALLAFVGLGFAFFASPNTNAIMALASPRDYGVTAAFVATMRNLGMVVSMAVIALVVTHNFGTAPLTQAAVPVVLTTMRTCFVVFAVICAVGVFTSLARRQSSRREPS